MTHFTEHSLEMAIISMFEKEGYVYTNGENVHKTLRNPYSYGAAQIKNR